MLGSLGKNVLVVDSAPFEFGLLSGVLARLTIETTTNVRATKIVCPPFQSCPTSLKLVGDYYPTAPRIVNAIRAFGFNLSDFPPYSFDDLHLPPEMDFTSIKSRELTKKLSPACN